MNELVEKAKKWAHAAHDSINQKRKYDEQPYWVHTDGVAELLKWAGESENIQAAGHLHDILEDVAPKNSEFSEQNMFKEFGPTVTNLVKEVTNVFTKEAYPQLNRAKRKHKEDQRLNSISKDGKSIKLADIINNVNGLVENDPSFAKIYIFEKIQSLVSLKDGNPSLYKEAVHAVSNEISKLKSCEIRNID